MACNIVLGGWGNEGMGTEYVFFCLLQQSLILFEVLFLCNLNLISSKLSDVFLILCTHFPFSIIDFELYLASFVDHLTSTHMLRALFFRDLKHNYFPCFYALFHHFTVLRDTWYSSKLQDLHGVKHWSVWQSNYQGRFMCIFCVFLLFLCSDYNYFWFFKFPGTNKLTITVRLIHAFV